VKREKRERQRVSIKTRWRGENIIGAKRRRRRRKYRGLIS
jgi:hypothetical protein